MSCILILYLGIPTEHSSGYTAHKTSHHVPHFFFFYLTVKEGQPQTQGLEITGGYNPEAWCLESDRLVRLENTMGTHAQHPGAPI